METGNIVSKDGTHIGYNKTGTGEGIIIVHGAGRRADDYHKLAHALSDSYTVYTYDRRGRGSSGKIMDDHCITRECDDLKALIHETGAENIFGHSMGGLIALETASQVSVNNVAVYEPPISVNNSIPQGFVGDFNKAVHKKQYERAMALSLKGLKMHEAAALPAWVLTMIIKLMKQVKNVSRTEWNRIMAETLPTLPIDLEMAAGLDNSFEKYKRIRAVTLLMGGSKSPSFLLQPLDLLKGIIPYSSRQIFEGFYHVAPEENVPEISSSLKQFFN